MAVTIVEGSLLFQLVLGWCAGIVCSGFVLAAGEVAESKVCWVL